MSCTYEPGGFDFAHCLLSHHNPPMIEYIIRGGGHGFKMLDDTMFLEIKQCPYTGVDEKN